MVKRRYRQNTYSYPEEKEEYYHNSQFKLRIDKSKIKFAGKGVITDVLIPKETFIDFYSGDISYTVKCGCYFVEIDETCGVNAILFPRCYMAMVNDAYHSNFTNNCEIRINSENKVEIWSINDIKPGEELFMSYGDEYWK